jgi:hypothetical protein
MRTAFMAALFLYSVTCTLVLADTNASTNPEQADPEPYVDQLITPIDGDEFTYPEEQDADQQPEGLRVYSTEYRHYEDHAENRDVRREDGFILNWQRETRHAGDLELLATIANSQIPDNASGNDGAGGNISLRQYDFAVNENWLMDNGLGVLRSNADPLLSSSFRMNLPSSLLAGAGTWSRSNRTDLRFSAGEIGSLGGGRLDNFDTTSGSLVSLGISHTINQHWLASAQIVSLSGSDEVVNHESLAGVLGYETDDKRHHYLGHFLSDSEGGNGIWLDGDDRAGRWRHRYGVFYLDPGLLWTDVALTDDQQGFYTRSEVRSVRYNLTVGTDLMENNVDNVTTLPQTRTSNVFITGNRRINSKTDLGATLSFLAVDARNDIAGEDSSRDRISVYLSRKFAIGNSRFEVFGSDIDNQGDEGSDYGIIWDQDWDFSRTLSLSTTLSHENVSDIDDETRRDSASLLFRHEPVPQFNWNGGFSYARIGNDNSTDTDNYSANLGMLWRFHKDWDARFDYTFSRAEQNISLLPEDELSEDTHTVMLSIRHTRKTGRRAVASGVSTGNEGFGEIRGVVFFDENRDGQRQAGERAASGIFVYLDRRTPRVTDNDGAFSFAPVPAGEHTLSIAVEDVPLPWGLDDETPQSVYVKPRGEAVHEFALTRINE